MFNFIENESIFIFIISFRIHTIFADVSIFIFMCSVEYTRNFYIKRKNGFANRVIILKGQMFIEVFWDLILFIFMTWNIRYFAMSKGAVLEDNLSLFCGALSRRHFQRLRHCSRLFPRYQVLRNFPLPFVAISHIPLIDMFTSQVSMIHN